jgi:hypothetical protein
VANVVIERITEGNHFNERREEHEKECHRIAPDHDELFEQDGTETAKGTSHRLGALVVLLRAFIR